MSQRALRRWPSQHNLVALTCATLLICLFPWLVPYFYWDINPRAYRVPLPELQADLMSANSSSHLNTTAPKIVHHRWNDEHIPEKWAKMRQTCKDLHPDYEFVLWTEESGRALLAEHFPDFLKVYNGYAYTIQQADIIRYFILYQYGGVYLDLDVECTRRMDWLRQWEVVLPATWPTGFSNDVLVAPAKHDFYKFVIDRAATWDITYGTKYPTVMFSTGPMFLTWQAVLYPHWRQIWILPKPLYGKYTHAPTVFFLHYHASMWHALDAQVFLFFWKMRLSLAICLFSVISCATLGCIWWKGAKRHPGDGKNGFASSKGSRNGSFLPTHAGTPLLLQQDTDKLF